MKLSRATFTCLIMSTLTFSLCINVAVAQKFKLPFRSSAANSARDDRMELNQGDGPWLIMCASFVGDEGKVQAENLARELREKYRLKAFTYKHEFNYSDTIEGIGWEVVEQNGKKGIIPKRMKPAGESQVEEIAVLVGDFPSVENGQAQKTLAQIKTLQPESLANFDASRGTSQQLRVWREMVKRASTESENKVKGPLGSAFLLPNPLLPDEYFAANRVDHFVLNLNKNIKYTLLDNPSTYSVRVATFRGELTFQLNEIKEKEREQTFLKRSGRPLRSSKLAEAADKAHQLTAELRRLGVDAYEFHDRNESYVCVGGFDWISKKDPSGETTLNPDVVKVINTFKASIEDIPNIPGAVCAQSLPKFRGTDIVFDAQPITVLVPRVETSTASLLKNWR